MQKSPRAHLELTSCSTVTGQTSCQVGDRDADRRAETGVALEAEVMVVLDQDVVDEEIEHEDKDERRDDGFGEGGADFPGPPRVLRRCGSRS